MSSMLKASLVMEPNSMQNDDDHHIFVQLENIGRNDEYFSQILHELMRRAV